MCYIISDKLQFEDFSCHGFTISKQRMAKMYPWYSRKMAVIYPYTKETIGLTFFLKGNKNYSRIIMWYEAYHQYGMGSCLGFVNYKKGCTRLAAANDKVYQLVAHGRWFSPGTPASSTTKTGHHDIAEILLKVAINTKNQNKKNQIAG